jgi:hypothetical protein
MRSREATALRLLQSSAEHSYDPDVDIDWEAPEEDDKLFLPEELVTLYGTPLWDTMTDEQKRDLGRYELAWITSTGIFAELGLMTMLVRVAALHDPTKSHVHYALTEIADECRHSTMFSRALEAHRRDGDPAPLRLPKGAIRIARLAGALLPIGPVSWAGTLMVEDILDKLQRETMNDERVQPRVRMVNRIHVLEEARHMTYARDELTRSVRRSGPVGMALSRLTVALLAYTNPMLQMHPRVYKDVGLDPYEARRQALANPHRQEALARHSERFVATMEDAGLIKGRVTKALWNRSGLRRAA